MRTQYTDQYNLTVQHEIRKDLVFQIGYVGSQGHRLLAAHDIDPGTPQTCLDLISILGADACGPFGSDSSYFIPGGTVLPVPLHLPYGPQKLLPAGTTVGPAGITLVGLRPYSSPNCNPLTGSGCPPDGVEVFGSIFSVDTIANSSYNSLQITLKHSSSRGALLVGYTYSKSIDQASALGDTVNPFNFKATRALSAWDLAHNFVASYEIQLPIEKLTHRVPLLTQGWSISGITRASTGFPVTIKSNDDNSLQGSIPNGVNNYSLDTADYNGQPLNLNGNPRNGLAYFNPSAFSESALGSPGNAARRSFHGPGELNFDLALLKDFKFTESKTLQFRMESFNTFNHAEFFGPAAVQGNVDSPTFGQVIKAAPPRLMQAALKFIF